MDCQRPDAGAAEAEMAEMSATVGQGRSGRNSRCGCGASSLTIFLWGGPMIGEYALPGSIVLLKLGMRLFLDQEVKGLDATKAVMAFPVDLSFLAFTFGAAGLVAASQQTSAPLDMKSVSAFIASCVLLSGTVIVLCKRSDKAFMLEKTSRRQFWPELPT